MTDLERYRDEIDEIDSEIVRLFEKRMKVSEEVAEYKIKTGKQVLDPARESQKIHTLKNKAHGDFNSLGVQELFRQIMAISRKRQYQLLTEHGIYGERNFTTVKHVPLENATVVFQGVEGAYSYAAMRQYFGKNIESYHVKTWRTAMEDVTHGKADYAVLPIENSTAGIVAASGHAGCTDRGYQGSLLSSSGACPVQGISGGKPFLEKEGSGKHRRRGQKGQ